ncbi:FeoA domain family [Synechococcus sp. PCC 7335]|uniref:FeoA family protein n=1 Tax=Synechococcus sp. (strain ATCC 29403 / PCC 7335) TaxID=91464 RepID=UPI00017EBC8F|nr:FeoA family protein [Synechococcus sp. PCC 7335]EDX84917.1 FeoA domain family [Synechococcus sp. PCC 7335]
MDEAEYDRRIDALERFPDQDDGYLAARSSIVCSLAMTSVGDIVQVVSLRGDSQTNRRLIDMGISVNVQGTIISRAEGGLVVFARDGCRLGLGATMAQKIFVKVLNSPSLNKSSANESAFGKSTFGQIPRSLEPSMNQTTSAERDTQPLEAKPSSKPLSELSVGDSGSVVGYEKGSRAYRKKLLAMGLTPGTAFTITHQAPMGDPIELQVRGFKLSLRKGEAATLQVVSNSSTHSASATALADEVTNLEPTSVPLNHKENRDE